MKKWYNFLSIGVFIILNSDDKIMLINTVIRNLDKSFDKNWLNLLWIWSTGYYIGSKIDLYLLIWLVLSNN